MQAVQRLFFICLVFVATLGAALGVLLYVSLIPFFQEIGLAATILIVICLACAAYMVVVFTITKTGIWWSSMKRAARQERLLTSGEVVVYLHPSGEFSHLSAQHEMAKIAPPAQIVDSDEDTGSPDEVILELWRRGVTLRNIEKVTGRKYHEIQKITSAAKSQAIVG